MYLQDVINSLKNIKLSLIKLEDTNFKNCVTYLEMTIQILENYKNNPGQIERQIPPNQISGNKKKSPENTLRVTSANSSTQCGSGKHWVRKRLKNGEPGYCRRNPHRK